MFHDDRPWCVHPVAPLKTLAVWVDPADGSTDFAVVKRQADPGGRFDQVASLTLRYESYKNALDHNRSVLAGHYDALASADAAEPRLEMATGRVARCCPFCTRPRSLPDRGFIR